MTSHQLANKLLAGADLPVVVRVGYFTGTEVTEIVDYQANEVNKQGATARQNLPCIVVEGGTKQYQIPDERIT